MSTTKNHITVKDLTSLGANLAKTFSTRSSTTTLIRELESTKPDYLILDINDEYAYNLVNKTLENSLRTFTVSRFDDLITNVYRFINKNVFIRYGEHETNYDFVSS